MSDALPAAIGARRLDAVGGALVVALALWTALISGRGAGRSEPILWLLAGLIIAVVAGAPTGYANSNATLAAVGVIAGAAITRWPPAAIVGGAIAVSLALGITVSAVVDDEPWLADSEAVRVELWSGAVDLVREEPWRGLGGGAFAERNPVTGDTDLRWAHHEYLELAVELGVVGLLLVGEATGDGAPTRQL